MRSGVILFILSFAVFAASIAFGADSSPVKEPATQKIEAETAAPKTAQPQKLTFGDMVAEIVSLDQPDFIENKYSRLYRYDKFDNPKLKLLRESEKLGELVKNSPDEFTAQLRLLGWTQKRIAKFGTPTSKAAGALDILTAVDSGQTFYCKHYASVFVSAAASLGYVARPLALRRTGDGPESTEHSIVEIWSNQHCKWVMFDPTYAVYISHRNIPLSAWEIRQRWFKNAGEGLKIHFIDPKGKACVKKITELPVTVGEYDNYGELSYSAKTLNKFALIGYIPNTDLMDSDYAYDTMFISLDQMCKDTQWHKRDNPAKPATEPYFALGQAAMTLKSSAEGISVELSTNTPNFDHYEFRIDSSPWKHGRPESWRPEAGTHTLELVAVNRFGVRGKISKLVINVQPAKDKSGGK